MRQKNARVLSLILSIVMVLSLATVIPMAVSAEGAPVMDGVKDDLYTAEKMTKITTGYDIGVSGAVAPNTDKIEMEVYYTWDDEFVYVFMDVKDSSATTGDDYFYFINHKEIDHGFIFYDSHGGYIQFKADGSLAGQGGAVVPAEYKVNRAAGSNNRSYELKYARNGNEEGFRISPAATNGAYAVSYAGKWGEGSGSKQVLFEDANTWHAEALEKIVGEDNTIDAEKDDRYTDSKKVFVSTAFSGDHGVEVENKSGMSYTIWVAWDDEFNYIYAEADDPNATCTYECFYFKNTLDAYEGYLFAQPGGGYIEFKNGTGAGTPAVLKSATKVETGKRKFEFKFERNPSATGFAFGLVGTPTGGYVVAHGNDYNSSDYVGIDYTDESTWVQNFVPQTEEPEDPKPEDPKPEDPKPEDPVEPPVDELGIDAVKDDRYDDVRCTTMSVAYAGPGGSRIANPYHIYIQFYYAWDDVNNYVYWEVHDPFNQREGYWDVLYYITNTLSAAGQMFAVYDGGYLQFNAVDGSYVNGTDVGGREIKYASHLEDGLRVYEVALPKTDGAIGFQISPTVSKSDFTFSISYNTNYYMLPNKNINYENAAGHWTDNSCIDADVMMDPEKLETAKAELAKVPADISSLTYEDHKDLIDGVKAVMDTIPATWSVFFDAEQYARYQDAVARMTELEAAVREAELKAIEDRIAALPETVTLEDWETVVAIKKDLEVLGALADYMDPAIKAAFTEKLGYLEGLQAPVKVDGVKDAIYDKDDEWPLSMGFRPWTSSDVDTIDPDSTGTIQTACDGKYMYFYVQVNKANGIVDLNGAAAHSNLTSAYDSVSFYVDLDPSVHLGSAPYQDAEIPGDHMLWFTMFADGQVLCSLNGKDYINQIGALVHFRDGNSYGFELRLPLVEGEESVKMSCAFSDPTWKDDGTGTLKYVEAESYIIALGPTWAYDYNNYGEKFIEDYATYYTYLEIAEMIEALPAPDSLENKDCERKANTAKAALELLSEEQLSFLSEDLLAKLDAVLAALDAIVEVPDYVYGDLNNDGNQDAVDALMVLQIAVDKLQPTDTQLAAADVSGDGNINAEDALYILQKAVDKIDLYPVEK